MRKDKIIYWSATGFMSAAMLASAFMYLTDQKTAEIFTHLGFTSSFRIELGIAKLFGALAIIIPQVPVRVKEWAYAGLGISFISASIAHGFSGDPIVNVIPPIIFLGILILSNIYFHKIKSTFFV